MTVDGEIIRTAELRPSWLKSVELVYGQQLKVQEAAQVQSISIKTVYEHLRHPEAVELVRRHSDEAARLLVDRSTNYMLTAFEVLKGLAQTAEDEWVRQHAATAMLDRAMRLYEIGQQAVVLERIAELERRLT